MQNQIHHYRKFQNSDQKNERLNWLLPEARTEPLVVAEKEGAEKTPSQKPLHKEYEFDAKKETALQLVKKVDAALGTAAEKNPHAEALKKEIIDQIDRTFDELHGKYSADHAKLLEEGIGSDLGKEKVAAFKKEADLFIAKIQARVEPANVKTEVEHAITKTDLEKTEDEKGVLQLKTALLKKQLERLGVSEPVQALARFMAQILHEKGVPFFQEGDRNTTQDDAQATREWFNEQLKNTDLIKQAVGRLAQEAPKYTADDYEAGQGVFEKLITDPAFGGEGAEGLARQFGTKNIEKAAQILAFRFHRIDGSQNPTGQPLYMDLTDNKIYTQDELKPVVEKAVKAMGGPKELDQALTKANQEAKIWNETLANLTEGTRVWGGPLRTDPVDHLDDLLEANPDLATVLARTNAIRQQTATKGREVVKKMQEEQARQKEERRVKKEAMAKEEKIIDRQNNLTLVADAIWQPNEGGDQLDLGNGITMEPIDAVMKRITAETTTVNIAIKEGETVIGHIELDLSGEKPATAKIIVEHASVSPTPKPIADIRKIVQEGTTAMKEGAKKALENKAAVETAQKTVTLPTGLTWGTAEEPNSWVKITDKEEPVFKYPILKDGKVVATLTIGVHEQAMTLIDAEAKAIENTDNAEKIITYLNANAEKLQPAKEAAAPVEAVAAKPAGTEEAEPEAIKPGRVEARTKLATIILKDTKLKELFAKSFPDIKDAATPEDLIKSKAMKDVMDEFVNGLSDVRVQMLKDSDTFKIHESEMAMLQKALIKGAHLENVGQKSEKEMKMIANLKTKDGRSFEDVFGKDSPVLEGISRGFTVGISGSGEIILNGKEKEPIKNIEDLRKLVEKDTRHKGLVEQFNALMKIDTTDADRTIAREAFNNAAKEEVDQLTKMQEQKAEIEKILSDPRKAKEALGNMGPMEALGALMQLFASLKAAFSSNPPDFKLVGDVLKDITGKPPRNPMDVMAKNKENFKKILDIKDPNRVKINDLLQAYFYPNGEQANELFNEKTGESIGIKTDTPEGKREIADLGRYRNEIKTPILNYLTGQMGFSAIAGITYNADSGRTTVSGAKNGTRYEVDFYQKDGKNMGEVFATHEVSKTGKGADGKEETKSVIERVGTPLGTFENVQLAQIQKALEKPAPAPQATVGPPATAVAAEPEKPAVAVAPAKKEEGKDDKK